MLSKLKQLLEDLKSKKKYFAYAGVFLLVLILGLFAFFFSFSKKPTKTIPEREGELYEEFSKEQEENLKKLETESKELEAKKEEVKQELNKKQKEIDNASDWKDIDRLAGVSADSTLGQ